MQVEDISTNEWERGARRVKVARLADKAQELAQELDGSAMDAAIFWSRATEAQWESLALLAGTHPASRRTQQVVVNALQARHRAAQRLDRSDPFAAFAQ
jgi:hypothetical protein